ncbi:hypothetical protein ACQEUU_29530 [Nonomuraea sp. CA-218870]|uniref:hypothetical protein n=1 Tax=Nonomuraea sp. CA-218870 TaxID=3239998 RepID=UPI003D94D768
MRRWTVRLRRAASVSSAAGGQGDGRLGEGAFLLDAAVQQAVLHDLVEDLLVVRDATGVELAFEPLERPRDGEVESLVDGRVRPERRHPAQRGIVERGRVLGPRPGDDLLRLLDRGPARVAQAGDVEIAQVREQYLGGEVELLPRCRHLVRHVPQQEEPDARAVPVRQPAVAALVPRVDGGGQQQLVDGMFVLLRPGGAPPDQQILGGLELLGLFGLEPGTHPPKPPISAGSSSRLSGVLGGPGDETAFDAGTGRTRQ